MLRRCSILFTFVALLPTDVACSSNDRQSASGSGGGAETGGFIGASGGNANGTGGAPAVGGATSMAAGGAANGAHGGALVGGGTTGTGGLNAAGTTMSAGGAPPLSSGGSAGSGATAGSSSGGTGGNASGGAAGASSGGAGPACKAGAPLVPGETKGTISVGGTSRTYILHVPASYSGTQPVPLVIDFHPIFGSGSGEKGLSGYAALSDTEGFVVAFPDGIDQAWNVGPCCTMSRSVDDIAFAKALVGKIEGDGCIDAKRVYATGFSMGGGMSHYLACHAADVFATVVPASFDLLTENEGDCTPARPITVLSFRGTADNVVPYAGGASNPPNGLPTIHFLGAVGTFEKWAMLDGCTGTPTAGTDGCKTYSQCNAGVEVTLCTIDGGGHAPGNAQQGWAMMKKHPMP